MSISVHHGFGEDLDFKSPCKWNHDSWWNNMESVFGDCDYSVDHEQRGKISLIYASTSLSFYLTIPNFSN